MGGAGILPASKTYMPNHSSVDWLIELLTVNCQQIVNQLFLFTIWTFTNIVYVSPTR